MALGLLIGFVFRLALAAVLPPGYDEVYYLFYGRHPSLSYFDHPLGVGLWSWLGQRLGDSLWLLRLPSVVSYTAALALLSGATCRWFGAGAAVWSVLLGSLCPLVFICGGVLLLPDSPLLLAIALLLWWCSRHPRIAPGSVREAMGLGAILAAITLAKYHALLLLPALLAWTLAQPQSRPAWSRPWPWLAVLVWALLASPLWWWNQQHGWVSLLFHSGRTGAGLSFRLQGSLLFLFSQLGLLFPTLGILLLLSLWPGRRGPTERPEAMALLRWLVWPQLVVFVVLAGRMQVMASWLVPAWWMLLPLAADWLARRSWSSLRLRLVGVGTAVVLPPLLLLAAAQTRWGILEPVLPTRLDPSAQLMTAGDLRAALQANPAVWQALRRADLIASHRYELPGFLALALGNASSARFTAFSDDARGFAFWDPPGGFRGAQGVVFAPVEPGQPLHRRQFPPQIGPLEPLGVVQVRRAGRPSMRLEFARFRRLSGPYPRPGPPPRDG
ncbi:MAG: glycosyltransferase family 39 protein [Cyanobacteriota bacterium]